MSSSRTRVVCIKDIWFPAAYTGCNGLGSGLGSNVERGFDGMGILCVFCVYDTIGNRCFEKTSFPKTILRDFRNAPFYILCLFHMIDVRIFNLSVFILFQNGPWFAMISICSCCSFWRNIDVSVFQQLSSNKCEFDSIWKQTLLGGSQMSLQMEKHKSFQK